MPPTYRSKTPNRAESPDRDCAGVKEEQEVDNVKSTTEDDAPENTDASTHPNESRKRKPSSSPSSPLPMKKTKNGGRSSRSTDSPPLDARVRSHFSTERNSIGLLRPVRESGFPVGILGDSAQIERQGTFVAVNGNHRPHHRGTLFPSMTFPPATVSPGSSSHNSPPVIPSSDPITSIRMPRIHPNFCKS